MLLFPVYVKPEITEAATKDPTPSTLTFTSTRNTATVHLDSISTAAGTFASSTVEQTASFSISTNNATGYTLNLKTSGDDTALTDSTNSNTSTNHLNTISSSITADDFTVNTWGLVPNKYRSSNTTITNDTNDPTYFPASSAGFTMDETFAANTTANDYTVGIGIKVNYDMKSATYSNNTIIAEYVANPVTYSINYYSNTEDTVTDMPLTNPQTGTVSSPTNPSPSQDITTTLASAPSRDGYTFLGWCAGNSAGIADTTNNTSITNITTTDDVDTCSSTVYDADQSFGINATGSSPDAYYLYAMWTPEAPDLPCEAGYICYRGNGATAGTMPDQEVTTSTVMLTSSNFSRPGYGFAGWNTSSDGTGTSYGPAETITPGDLSTEGLKLYAKWLAPSGVLQTWAGASNMNAGDVIALRDNRDNEVYTVAKLADNNIWITENLRLVPNTANITAKNTNNPTTAFLEAYPSSSSSTTQCSTDNATCDDHVYFYTGNMDRAKTQSPINNDYNYAWYSYGTMYNWYTATAGHGVNSKNSGSVSGDICPSGWHLPTGGSSGEYAALSTALGGTSSTGATNIRKYPNNFIWSGDYNPSTQTPDGRGVQARLWSATAQSGAKSYRMGFNSSSITPAGTWNKWDNFAVRCIYQGGNLPYSAVTVDFEGTGINSLTFTSQGYDTETATPASPTVDLVEGVEYTATATLTTGYEVSSWSTTTNGTLGNTTTANPAVNPNTYIITGDATLTVTGQITPTYDVTVTLGEHVTGISFSHPTYGTINITPQNSTDNGDGTYTNAATLYRGAEYTLASSYEDGYTLHEWVAGANSTIGSTTSAATTYSITGNTTLGITAEETDELTYTLVYSAGQGTDAPDSETETVYTNTHDFTITNSAPIYYGYTFTGWSETPDANNNGTTIDYTSGDTITVASTGATTTKTLYPVYQPVSSCPSGYICYYENGADVLGGGRGTMSNQSASSNTDTNLIPTNYSKAGYGFAGWTTDANATPYGPNATITTPDLSSTGLALYAKWVKSTGTLQTWNGCNAMTTNQVIALTDSRDNETYAVAKLADDNCWIVENLRLDPSTANITNQNTHNPASGFATAAASSSSVNTMCNTDGDTNCNDQIQYNTNSLNRSLTQTYNGNNNSSAWYSYGVYYNWHTATAGNGTISTEANANAAGDICPARWHLPTSTATGEYAALNTAVNGSTSSDAGLRAYPANFLWSGDYKNTQRNSSYSNGRYWTATGYDSANGYRFGLQSTSVTPSGNYRKWDGFAVRCVYDGETPTYGTVTITIPTGVSSVTFVNNKYGTQTATASNNIISLVQGVTYTATANIDSSYDFIGWSNGQNSTIGSTTASSTTFVINDDSTLALATSLKCSNSFPGVTYMQDITISNKAAILASITEGAPYYLYDKRDNERYCVSKLADGNLWMLDNLAIDLTKVPLNTLKGNTNASDFALEYLKGVRVRDPNTDPNGRYAISSVTGDRNDNNYTFSDPIIEMRYKNVLSSGITEGSKGQNKIGGYYNYCAASAGSYCYGIGWDHGNGEGPAYDDDTEDICPSGWRMPKGNDGSEYKTLYEAYSENDTAFKQALSLTLSGYYVAELDDKGTVGNYWTSTKDKTYSSNRHMNALVIDESGVDVISVDHRVHKNSVRCLVRPDNDSYDVRLKLDKNIVKISIYNETYGTVTVKNNYYNSSELNGRVMLKVGVPYTITAKTATGYMVSSWSTDENGTLSSTTTNPTTFSISDRSMLYITAQEIPSYDVTVSLDSHSSSVSFYNADYGTQTVTNNNNNSAYTETVSLRQGVQYTITSSFAPGYGIGSWTTGSNGTLGSTSTTSTTYVITGASSLSLRSVFGCNNPVPGVTYMQDITADNRATVLASLAEDTPYYLKDRRDDETYCVSKLKDGNLWMLDNLRLGGTSEIILTSSDTNINIPSWTLPASSNTFNSYATAIINTSNNNSTTTSYGPGSGKIGTYYNYCAVSAGYICTSNYNFNYGSPDRDVCPKGWRLPTSGSNGEYQSLYTAYSSDIANFRNAFSATLSGSFTNSSVGGRGSYGYFWSSTYDEYFRMYRLKVSSSEVDPSTEYSGRNYGSSVRCLLRPANDLHLTVVSFDTTIRNISIYNATYGTQTITTSGSAVQLKEGVPYIITTTAASGYRFLTWFTDTNGTLGNDTTNPTTFIISGESSLSVSTQEIPIYDVTVNLDEYTTSVSFYNSDYSTQTVTNTNNNNDGTHTATIQLREGVVYTITGTFIYGYQIKTWSTDANGTLGDASSAGTTYTISGASTLSVTGQLPPPASTCDTPVPGITYMQDITPSNKTTILASLTEEAPYYLRDSRDNEPYCVSKLKDGNLWMLDNLRLGGTSAIALTPSDTNLPSTVSSWSLPSNNSQFDTYSPARVNTSYKNTTLTSYGPGSGKIGVYYSYCAVSAGNICSSSNSKNGSPDRDICPKGWRLPTGGSSGEYQSLYTAYSSNATSFKNALSTINSGYYHGINAYDTGAYGYLWSSTRSGNYMLSLRVLSYGVNTAYDGIRYFGFTARCLLHPANDLYSVNVNLGTNVSSVSFYNATYGTQTVTNTNNNNDGTHTATIQLREGIVYTITASFKLGYQMNTWSTDTNGTLGDASSASTTYTISGASKLSVTSQLPPPASTCDTPVPGITYMQDITASNGPTILDSLTEEAPYYLRDSRDNEPYCVSKLKDGNLWMLDNLRLGGTSAIALTPSDTNLPSTVTSWTIPASISSELESYTTAQINTTSKNTTTTSYGAGSGKIGVFYNYCAVSAGYVCADVSSNGSPDHDICPKGWRMPTGGPSGEYQALYAAYSSNDANFKNALSIPLSGQFTHDTASEQGFVGLFWSSTVYDSYRMHDLYIESNSISTTSGANRSFGYSARCLLRPAGNLYTTTVNLGTGISSVSIFDIIENTQTITTSGSNIQLREGITYTITASISDGYTFSSWANDANSTIGNVTVNPTTFTVSSDTSLSASAQEIPSYNITVNLDAHTSSVSFYNATYGTQTVTNSNNNNNGTHTGTVSLKADVSYILTSDFASGFEIDSWSTTNNGTIGSATSANTTYEVSGSSTLSISSKFIPPSSTCNTPIPGVTYMQDITSSNSAAILANLTTNDAYYLVDNRDNTAYCVSKLADGNLWMLDNLAIDLATVPLNTLKGNTNATDTSLEYLKGVRIRNPNTDVSGNYATAGVSANWPTNSYSAPLMQLSGICADINSCANPTTMRWDKDDVPSGATTNSKGQNKIGGYYNFCAASAGSYCYGNGANEGTSIGDATEDICPSGWHIPTGASTGEYQALATAITSTANNYYSGANATAIKRTLSIPLSGWFSYDDTDEGAYLQGSNGFFWSSTRYGNCEMYRIDVGSSTIETQVSGAQRHTGHSIRCLLN